MDDRHVWVARDKASEWAAIHSSFFFGHLPFRPLIEAVCEPFIPDREGRTQTPAQVIRRLADNLSRIVWAGPVWVDFGNLSVRDTLTFSDIARMLDDLRASCGGWSHLIIPVVRTTSAPQVADAAFRWATTTGSGLCIRVMGLSDLAAQSLIVDTTVRQSGLSQQQIDLIVDAQDLPSVMSQQQIATQFPLSQTSRTWAIVAGTFPSTVTDLSPDKYLHRLPRTEWTEFSDDVSLPNGWRTPVFGDYATQGAIYVPSPGHAASPTIRYTAGEEYVVLRGRKGKEIDFNQYIGHSRFLRAEPLFRDVTSTNADTYVERIAVGTNGTGNASTWRVASLQRHVSVTEAQWAAHILMRPLVHSSGATP